MIPKRLWIGALWSLALFTAATCDRVNDLDDSATISAVRVEATTPSIIIGAPQIEQDDVIIPLIFGKYLFPIEIEVTITTAQTIDKILGLDAGQRMVFESLDDINRIDLIALSGVVHSYIFRLLEVPSRESADIEQCNIVSWAPEHFLFVPAPLYDIILGHITIIGIHNDFPFTLTPEFTVSEGARLDSWSTGQSLTFTSYDTQFSLKVVAESGKERLWRVMLKQADIITPAQAPNADVRARLSLSAQTMAVSLSQGEAESAIKAIEVDAEQGIIRIVIPSTDPQAEWNARLSFPVNPYSQLLGYTLNEPFVIKGFGMQKRFYLVDRVDGYATAWKVESVQWLNPAAEIESFEVLGYQSQFALIELGTPVIRPELAKVEIPVEKGFDFPLVIDSYRLSISPDAHLVAPIPQKLIFEDFNTRYTVKIVAQNEKIKSWDILLSDVRAGNNEARVTGYTLKSYQGTSQTENNIVLHPQATIDANNKVVTLHVLDWPQKLPVTVNARMDISPGALLMPFSFALDHELTFNTIDDTFSFTIISESGATEQTWTIVLQNDAPSKSNAKEVIDFASGTPSFGFTFTEKYLEFQKRQITLMVSNRISGTPLIFAPRITVSPNARLLGIVSGAPISLSFDEPQSFTVQAEDESTQEWRIVLVYAPQIPNSDFESWGKANNSDMNLLPANGTGWCTANNSALTNTTRVAGYHSPYAAQMQTLLQTMNFVIFKITSIAAATSFTGKFTLKTGVNDVYNPISMTNMGIPFTGTTLPVAFSIDYKYLRGSQLMHTEPNRGALIPSFKNPTNIPGTDAASLRVELFYHPAGTFDYISARNQELVAKGELLETNSVPNWTSVLVPIEVVPGREGVLPTHIVVVLTSSHEGDYFKGAPGSTLTADNFSLIYYQPETGARRLE